jgi:hypothetical protein
MTLFGSRIYGSLGRGYRRAAAAVPWWLSGGVAAESCVVAYQPKGAADERGQARFGDEAARESFERDYNELMRSEHLVTGEALRAAELGDSVVVKPAVLVALGELLEDG